MDEAIYEFHFDDKAGSGLKIKIEITLDIIILQDIFSLKYAA